MAEQHPLTPKQEAFVREYVIDNNGTQAAIRAGYSAKTACEQAARLLANVKVKEAIQAAQARVAEAAGISAVMVALEYKKIAFSDLTDFVEWGPNGVTLKTSADLGDARRAVSEVSETVTEAGGSKRIKLHDKKGALDSLCKMLGFNAPDRQELAGPNGGPIPVEVSDAKQRLAERLARAHQRTDPRQLGGPE